jgi:hypothetical protein
MGCYPTWFWSVPGIIVISVVPLLMVLMSLIFLSKFSFIKALIFAIQFMFKKGLALRNLSRHRAATAKYFSKRAPILSSTRFFRLMVLVFVQLILSMFLALAVLCWLSLRNGTVQAWVSWSATHSQFSSVWIFSRAMQTAKELRWQTAIRCLTPASGICIFVFFCNVEVLGEYQLMYARVLERVRWCCGSAER